MRFVWSSMLHMFRLYKWKGEAKKWITWRTWFISLKPMIISSPIVFKFSVKCTTFLNINFNPRVQFRPLRTTYVQINLHSWKTIHDIDIASNTNWLQTLLAKLHYRERLTLSLTNIFFFYCSLFWFWSDCFKLSLLQEIHFFDNFN